MGLSSITHGHAMHFTIESNLAYERAVELRDGAAGEAIHDDARTGPRLWGRGQEGGLRVLVLQVLVANEALVDARRIIAALVPQQQHRDLSYRGAFLMLQNSENVCLARCLVLFPAPPLEVRNTVRVVTEDRELSQPVVSRPCR